MIGRRTLILYFTKSRVTGENAEIIGNVLREEFGHFVDVVDLRTVKKPDVTLYDNVIIGSGVRIGMWYGRAKRQLKNKALADKKVAIFLSSMMAGDPETYPKARAKFLVKVLAKYPHIQPVAMEAFGGRMPFGEKADFTDPEKVRAWAHELGEKLKADDITQ